MTLTADHVDWLALLWVHQGGVVTYRGIYLERDRPLPRFLFPELLLDVLVADGLLAVAQPDDQGRARVSLTETGSVRLVQLCEQLARRPMPGKPVRRVHPGTHPQGVSRGVDRTRGRRR